MKAGENGKKQVVSRSVFGQAFETIGKRIFNSFAKRVKWDGSGPTFGFRHSILDLIVTDRLYRVRHS